MKSISWKTLEFEQFEKGKIWFIVFGLISLVFLGIVIYWKSFTTALLLILAILLITVYAIKKPEIIKITLKPQGIFINSELTHHFSEINSFWIFYDPPETKEISLRSKRMFFPDISIPLGKTDPNKIRKYLLKFLPEEKQEQSIIDIIAKRLKF
jgi:uncharacterized membrane protein YobD (UPF0266 family)